jgi:hypothetical protein
MRWLVFVASLLVLAIMGAFVFKKCADNPFCLSEVEVASQRAPELMGGLSFFDTRMLRVLTTMLREFYLKTPAQFLQFNTWFPAGFGSSPRFILSFICVLCQLLSSSLTMAYFDRFRTHDSNSHRV